jgi:hypothetical protein
MEKFVRSHDFAASARQNSASTFIGRGRFDGVIGIIGSEDDENALTTEVAKSHRVGLFSTSRFARTALRSIPAHGAKTDQRKVRG